MKSGKVKSVFSKRCASKIWGGSVRSDLKNSTPSPWKRRKNNSSAIFCATGAWRLSRLALINWYSLFFQIPWKRGCPNWFTGWPYWLTYCTFDVAATFCCSTTGLMFCVRSWNRENKMKILKTNNKRYYLRSMSEVWANRLNSCVIRVIPTAWADFKWIYNYQSNAKKSKN